MKSNILVYITFSFLLISCSFNKSRTERTNTQVMEIRIPDTLKTSSQFKRLCKDLSLEMENVSDTEKYTPSADMQKKYGLQTKDKHYYAKGYMHINPSFDKEAFGKIGAQFVDYTGSIISYSIPVNHIPQLLKMQGITYIELATKVNMIK